MEHQAEPELAIHFHIYRNKVVLLEWHDAFSQPILLSGNFSKEQVQVLAERMGTRFKMVPGTSSSTTS
ncbi:MAG: hypothetical protein ACE14M_14585 [Terriglobales bacterium]